MHFVEFEMIHISKNHFNYQMCEVDWHNVVPWAQCYKTFNWGN
jgi:hypothetical protein